MVSDGVPTRYGLARWASLASRLMAPSRSSQPRNSRRCYLLKLSAPASCFVQMNMRSVIGRQFHTNQATLLHNTVPAGGPTNFGLRCTFSNSAMATVAAVAKYVKLPMN